MTVSQAVKWLQGIEKKHGGDIPVYFDCPVCRQSFEPGVIETTAVHLAAHDERKKAQR